MSVNFSRRAALGLGAAGGAAALGLSSPSAAVAAARVSGPECISSTYLRQKAKVNNYGSTHPAVQAHAVIGRTMMDYLPTGPAATASLRAVVADQIAPFVPNHGG